MCIRDRHPRRARPVERRVRLGPSPLLEDGVVVLHELGLLRCLLYTSDAADDLLCVDLGGRRIIKKKNNHKH